MKKTVLYILYWLWQLTFGAIQTLAGVVMFLLCFRGSRKHSIYRGAVVSTWKKPTSASVGPFLFLAESATGDWYHRLLAHEYGHTIQSLILGPLYLLLVGVPSFVWCNARFFQRLRKERGISYYAVYPENWANRLGGVK